MDIDDRSDPNVPGSSREAPFQHPDWATGSAPNPGGTTSPRIGRRSILRRLASEWWRILGLWLILSTPVAYLIYAFVEPTYEARSLLRAEPTTIDVYIPGQRGATNPDDVRPYLETQVQLIKSDSVLDAAIAKPEISTLEMIRSSKDPKADLRERMHVAIVGKNTHLIEVSLDSRDPEEAAKIVNAVVDTHIEQHTRYHQRTNSALKSQLENELEKLGKQIQNKQDELEQLVSMGHVTVDKLQSLRPMPAGKDEGTVESSFHSVTEEQYKEIGNRLLQADFELMDAQARLEAARLPKAQASTEKIRDLDSAVEEARKRRELYQSYMTRIQVRSTSQSTAQLRASKLNQDLTYLRRLHEAVKQRLGQLEFEIGQEAYRIEVQDKASAPRVPANNKRFALMGGAAAGLYFLILGLFVVRELTARGVAMREATG